ncbi:hypothetical protein Hanom_Chr09g00823141 [Helianthus anomalus]
MTWRGQRIEGSQLGCHPRPTPDLKPKPQGPRPNPSPPGVVAWAFSPNPRPIPHNLKYNASSSPYSVNPTNNKPKVGSENGKCKQSYLYTVGIERLLSVRPANVKCNLPKKKKKS